MINKTRKSFMKVKIPRSVCCLCIIFAIRSPYFFWNIEDFFLLINESIFFFKPGFYWKSSISKAKSIAKLSFLINQPLIKWWTISQKGCIWFWNREIQHTYEIYILVPRPSSLLKISQRKGLNINCFYISIRKCYYLFAI